jgi:transposase
MRFMPTDTLISLPGFTLLEVHLENGVWHASLASAGSSCRCPSCGTRSSNLHSRYVRTVADLPIAGKPVVLELHVHRFRCRDPSCSRRIFCERFDDPKRYAQRTERQRITLGDLGVELGGRAGVRAAGKLGLSGGRNTVLNAIRSTPLPEPENPKVIGVDDFAFKRGRRYGTVIVNLETHGVLDLLPDRKPATLAAWLKAHQSVNIVTRDRSKEYAQGITAGAPRARQVVDRWHLLKNLRETLQRVVDADRKLVGQIIRDIRNAVRLPRSSKDDQARGAARGRRQARYELVRTAFAEVGSISGTAKRLGVSRWLVRESLKPGNPCEREPNKRIASQLDPFESHLFARWTDGCRSPKTVWLELREQGYRGSLKSVERWTRKQRLRAEETPDQSATKRPDRVFPTRNLAWLLLRENADLSDEEREVVASLERGCPTVTQARGLALRFAKGLRDRQPKTLVPWLLEAQTSGIPALKEFAVGLERELAAIKAAFSLPWSNGPVEGVVNRIKLIKRQMFGRAGFDLLRRRALLAA